MIPKQCPIVLAFLYPSLFSFGQELASFSSLNNTGCSGIIANNVNLTPSGICRGPGIQDKNGTTYNSKNWTTNTVIDSNDYIE